MQSRSKKVKSLVLPIGSVTQKIFLIRGQKVMLDFDLARLYKIPTMRLNEQVKRNKDRFPVDFMFQINDSEKDEVIANCDNLNTLKYSAHLPYAFTEHGVAMLSSVLKSNIAIKINIFIIRAFIEMRNILSSNKELGFKIEEITREQKLQNKHINTLYSILEKLMVQPSKSKHPIGFDK